MRNALPNRVRHSECGIVNLDDEQGAGTHWVAYRKRGSIVEYFDSFGNLQPPHELIKYFGKNTRIEYNYRNYQKFSTYNCGHLCLKFLYK